MKQKKMEKTTTAKEKEKMMSKKKKKKKMNGFVSFIRMHSRKLIELRSFHAHITHIFHIFRFIFVSSAAKIYISIYTRFHSPFCLYLRTNSFNYTYFILLLLLLLVSFRTTHNVHGFSLYARQRQRRPFSYTYYIFCV